MDAGFLLDKSYSDSYFSSTEWAEGAPESSFWSGLKVKGRERYPVTTFRCDRCGYLESYARRT
jgi:hypothetical protein